MSLAKSLLAELLILRWIFFFLLFPRTIYSSIQYHWLVTILATTRIRDLVFTFSLACSCFHGI